MQVPYELKLEKVLKLLGDRLTTRTSWVPGVLLIRCSKVETAEHRARHHPLWRGPRGVAGFAWWRTAVIRDKRVASEEVALIPGVVNHKL